MAKLAFDTGGTFTDFALLDDDGELHLHKVLSTPKNPAEAVVQGATELLDRFASVIDLAKLQVLGATTVVTNAVLERKGVETGFISTAGFQDMLRIRNEGRYDLYDLNLRYPDPLVTRANSFGAEERMTADGAVVTELKEDAIREIAGRLREQGHQIRRGLPAARLQIPEARTAHCRAAARRKPRHLRVAFLGGLSGGARIRPRLDDGRQCLYPPANGRACRPFAA